ncbi:hypothetical protein OJF2_10720 [Aquisphaera giovannonii]|uniref:Uncharacterized protein n=1 Tax=Aquisphaera giovannonii TaxID=406548 RepID=A0A5B9VW54_9BACT|nr:hypothetical protein [Aquisphaera giovannonii]QEH32593.1 hypothetical protein OJF2_10720 [Aquisphaera giovannonii]
MSRYRPVPLALVLLAAPLVGSVAARPCAGQVMIRMAPAVEKAADRDADDAAEDEAPVDVAQPGVVMFNDDTFDQWVFGESGLGRNGHNKLDTRLLLQVDDVARVCRLSDLQKKKLFLAGKGDIKRFFERVDAKKKDFDKVKNDQNKVMQMYQDLQAFQAVYNSGTFGDDSLYAKTLKKLLGDEADGRYDKILEEKRRFRLRAKVELVVTQLDQSIGFTHQQREKLIEVILNESEPPERFGQYDYYLVLYLAGRIPEEKLRPILGDQQWKFLERQLAQGRGMEQFLRQQGMLPPRDKDPRRAAGARGIAEAFARALREPAAADGLPADVFATPPRNP